MPTSPACDVSGSVRSSAAVERPSMSFMVILKTPLRNTFDFKDAALLNMFERFYRWRWAGSCQSRRRDPCSLCTHTDLSRESSGRTAEARFVLLRGHRCRSRLALQTVYPEALRPRRHPAHDTGLRAPDRLSGRRRQKADWVSCSFWWWSSTPEWCCRSPPPDGSSVTPSRSAILWRRHNHRSPRWEQKKA